jgi:serine---pyruvate transaminase
MKYRLFAPGPTPVSEAASLAAAGPMIHHRTADFEKILGEVLEGLKWLYQTKQDVLILASSGTGAMEASVVNTLSKGDKVIVIDGGKFGERWWKIAQAYGLETDIIKVEWGHAVDPNEVEKRLEQGGYRAVFVQASESSTGVYHPIEELALICKARPEVHLVVDAISALGAVNLPLDDWGIDVLIGGSQKAFGLPPGLAFIALSEKAWKAAESATLPKFYFDLKREKASQTKNTTAFTPAISLILSLQEVLRTFKEEGLKNLFARHTRMAEAVRAAVQAMGLELYAKDPVNSLTAIKAPDGLDGQKIYKTLQEKFNITVAGGQDQAKGKIFRIAHLGYFDELDMVTILGAIEWCLADLGFPVKSGAGVAKALEVFRS